MYYCAVLLRTTMNNFSLCDNYSGFNDSRVLQIKNYPNAYFTKKCTTILIQIYHKIHQLTIFASLVMFSVLKANAGCGDGLEFYLWYMFG